MWHRLHLLAWNYYPILVIFFETLYQTTSIYSVLSVRKCCGFQCWTYISVVSMEAYLTRFQWEGARFPPRQPIPSIVDLISKVSSCNLDIAYLKIWDVIGLFVFTCGTIPECVIYQLSFPLCSMPHRLMETWRPSLVGTTPSDHLYNNWRGKQRELQLLSSHVQGAWNYFFILHFKRKLTRTYCFP